MKVKGFGAWQPKDGSNGGYRKSGDGYNKSLKKDWSGPKKIWENDTNGYKHTPEMLDLEKEQSDDSKNKSKDNLKRKKESRQRLLRQVVGVTVGSVVVVTSYQTMVDKRAQKPEPVTEPTTSPVAPVEEPETLYPVWNWSDDNQTVTVELNDKDGKLVIELSAAVNSATTQEATCNAEGVLTYTAKVEKDGKEYSDSRTFQRSDRNGI